MFIPHFIYPSIGGWMFPTQHMLPPFGYPEKCCCEHGCTDRFESLLSVVCTSRKDVARSHGKSIFCFLRNHDSVFLLCYKKKQQQKKIKFLLHAHGGIHISMKSPKTLRQLWVYDNFGQRKKGVDEGLGFRSESGRPTVGSRRAEYMW